MDAKLAVGDTFQLYFVWQLPSQDFMRAIFLARVDEIQYHEARYLVTLAEFLAGRQESGDGQTIRSREEMTQPYWGHVAEIVGRQVQVAYESADSRPLLLRVETLTGENKFFRRFLPDPKPEDESSS